MRPEFQLMLNGFNESIKNEDKSQILDLKM